MLLTGCGLPFLANADSLPSQRVMRVLQQISTSTYFIRQRVAPCENSVICVIFSLSLVTGMIDSGENGLPREPRRRESSVRPLKPARRTSTSTALVTAKCKPPCLMKVPPLPILSPHPPCRI